MELMEWKLGNLHALAALFAIGSVCGWCLEVIFRRFFSKKNPERKWLNPGFCVGPYLPLYGCGVVVLYLMAYIGYINGYDENIVTRLILFVIMALMMTLVELIAGVITVYGFKMRLWDYRNEWGNFKGLICPKFSFFWGVLSAIFYFVLFPLMGGFLVWFNEHLQFGFFLGLFYGVFILDVIFSSGAAMKIRAYAKENNVIVSQQSSGTPESSRIGGLGKGLLNFLFNSRVGKRKDPESEEQTA